MTSGVSRQSVRSRRRWRMISCPAAKQMRWVNPSMATVSPSRTSSAMASRIDATLDVTPLRALGRLGAGLVLGEDRVESGDASLGHVGAGALEDGRAIRRLLRRDDEWRRDPDGRVSGTQDEESALEARDLDGVRHRGALEFDADHEAEPADLADEPPVSGEGSQRRQELAADALGVPH